jgi:hypothetical protein
MPSSSSSSLPGSKRRERENGDEELSMQDDTMEVSEGRRSVQNELSPDMNPAKMAKTGKLYSCMYCKYSADKKVSLNRHMRMHSGGPSIPSRDSNEDPTGRGSGSTTPNNVNPGSNIGMNKNLPEGVNAVERYCQDCDIQFSSIRTFRVHKQYYCRTRHVLKAQMGAGSGGAPGASTGSSPTPVSMKVQDMVGAHGSRKTSGSPVPSECSPVSTPGPMSAQPYVVLPTNPMIIIPYCYVQAASILPGNVLPSQNALIVLPNGSVQGLPCTSIPVPIPSPSPKPQQQQSGVFVHSNFSGCTSVKNNGTPGAGNGNGSASLSPSSSSQPQSVFNDPKDIIRKISSITKASTHSSDHEMNSEAGESGGVVYKNETAPGGTSYNNNEQASTSSSQNSADGENVENYKDKTEPSSSSTCDEPLDENHDGTFLAARTGRDGSDENIPAIDLTLRRAYSKKELSGDEEKENREVCLRLQNSRGEQTIYDSHGSSSDANSSKRMLMIPIGTSSSLGEFHRERELSSPCERLSVGSGGGGSCGKRTPRPSSTSISSSCSTPPALLCEPKINGMISRLSPMTLDNEGEIGTANNRNHHHHQSSLASAMMMASPASFPNHGDISSFKNKGSVDTALFDVAVQKKGSHSASAGDTMSRGKRVKMSPITTQLPGGAILTTTNSLTLAEMLVSGSSPEMSESLAKLNPQVLINAAQSGSPMGLNPVLLQALSQADPEMVMRMFDPIYLSSLQQTIQQQQQQQHAQVQQATIKRGYSKCIECDIVFYKHENYVVHKEHYCAARLGSAGSAGKSNEPDNHQVNRKEAAGGFSRMSSCSSPAKSDADGDECLSPPSSSLSHRKSSLNSQSGINSTRLPRKSTDSTSSDFFPHPLYDIALKPKSRSPHTSSTVISISPIPSPKDGKDASVNISKEKHSSSLNQYPCVHCGVKYSSIDNLKAHQSFYCTKRNPEVNLCDGNELSSKCIKKLGTDETGLDTPDHFLLGPSSSNSSMKGLVGCSKCKLSIPEDQLISHSRVCLGTSTSNGGGGLTLQGSNTTGLAGTGGESGNSRNLAWKCPCCDTYSPTVSAAQKHLEIHSGIRAFKCLLCGYRGNTLRGMRTHIRTHFDKRVGGELLEGEYMTCITAQELDTGSAPSTNSNTGGRHFMGESRTSAINHGGVREARSPIERNKLNNSNSPSVMSYKAGTSSSASSPENLPDVKLFSEGYALHSGCLEEGMPPDVDKLENNNKSNYACNVCKYSSSYRTHLIRHMKLVHNICEDSAEKIINEMNLVKINSSGRSGGCEGGFEGVSERS